MGINFAHLVNTIGRGKSQFDERRIADDRLKQEQERAAAVEQFRQYSEMRKLGQADRTIDQRIDLKEMDAGIKSQQDAARAEREKAAAASKLARDQEFWDRKMGKVDPETPFVGQDDQNNASREVMAQGRNETTLTAGRERNAKDIQVAQMRIDAAKEARVAAVAKAIQGNGKPLNAGQEKDLLARVDAMRLIDSLDDVFAEVEKAGIGVVGLESIPGVLGNLMQQDTPNQALFNQARGAMEQLVAGKTHELFGGALTPGEVKRIESHLPAAGIQTSPSQLRTMIGRMREEMVQIIADRRALYDGRAGFDGYERVYQTFGTPKPADGGPRTVKPKTGGAPIPPPTESTKRPSARDALGLKKP